MDSSSIRILAVDDDRLMRQILTEFLEEAGYDIVTLNDGAQAWDLLQKEGNTFDAILLDRMMPVMDGMEVLAKLKASESLQHIPVIMQTAAGSTQQIKEGLDAGAFYYLTKPFAKEVLLSIVQAAVRDSLKYHEAQEDVEAQGISMSFMKSGVFRVRTLKDVQALTTVLAKACPDPLRVIAGLNDLLVNGVEHGNLGITYDEKTKLIETDQWQEEITRRLSLPEYADKWVNVTFERYSEEIHLTIKDQGKGFDWEKYIEISVDLAFATHGRGIAMAKALSFDEIEYRENGTEVFCLLYTLPFSDPDSCEEALAGACESEA